MADDEGSVLQPNESNVNYEHLYNELLKKQNILKMKQTQQEAELLSLKKPAVDYKKVNQCLRMKLNILKKELNLTNSMLKTTKKKF